VSTVTEAVSGRFVSENVAVLGTSATEATTLREPANRLAVGTGEVATPVGLVATDADSPPGNVTVARAWGAANVTVAPPTGFPKASVTVACRGRYSLLTKTLCGVPPVAVTQAAGPVRLVS
jgi:hypothetical protein